MCIICVELDKKRLSPWEAERNLGEMTEKIGETHSEEVKQKISDLKTQEFNLNFDENDDLEEEIYNFYTWAHRD